MTTTLPTVSLRPAHTRGATNLGWLDSKHGFSFGRYHDPDRMGYHGLRVLNDDRVAPGGGFPPHPHDNMEIFSWVLDGQLAHRDSTGAQSVITPGTAQLMTAGTGVTHSEFNASDAEPVHFLQVWVQPTQRGETPDYQELATTPEQRRNRFAVLATPDGRDGSLRIRADANVYVADVEPGQRVEAQVESGRMAYLHIATGAGTINGTVVSEGDAVTLETPGTLQIDAGDDATQVMWFDLSA